MTALSKLAAALLLGGLAACASSRVAECASGEQASVSETLYFGTQTPDGTVSPEQWSQFLATDVSPRFPRGLTVWPAAGQWQSEGGAITRESSYVLTLLHPDDAASDAAVRAIVDSYRWRFRQEAVLRVRSRACASF